MTAEHLTGLGLVMTFLTLIANGLFAWLRARRRDQLEERHRLWDIEDRKLRQAEVVAKIDANTKISSDAFDVANHVNEKIATVAEVANRTAVASMSDVMRELGVLRVDLSGVKAAVTRNTEVLKKLGAGLMEV
jgi:hypothetical protein